jgi:ribosomal protein S18 acetylase RimI-like enzyme
VSAANEAEGLELPIDPDGSGLLYREGGEVLGYVGFELGKEVEATGVVLPSHRRRGYGTKLLEGLIETCRANNVETCYIVTDEASPSGKAFVTYTRAGYRTSEYRMVLDRSRFQPVESEGSLELQSVGVETVELFASLLSTGFGTPLDDNRAWLGHDMRAPGRRFWIAYRGSVPVGTVRVIGVHADVYTTALTVLPEYRGQGYGRQILSHITHMLTEEHWEQILIEVETENRNALGLYRSLGYRETRTYGFYQLPLPSRAAGT